MPPDYRCVVCIQLVSWSLLIGTARLGHGRARMGGMVTGELRRQIDAVWNDFWSGGISNPLEVTEQLTYLLFVKALDEQQTLAENKAYRTHQPIPAEDDVFPAGQEFRPEGRAQGRPYGDMRWSRFKHLPAAEMYDVVDNYVFAFLQQRAAHSSHAQHMAGARFKIPTPALLQKAVDGLDAVPMADRDTKGDVYEYMLSKIATAGQNGQFRRPRHIIELMVEMTALQPDDVICDPASGTCGLLLARSAESWASRSGARLDGWHPGEEAHGSCHRRILRADRLVPTGRIRVVRRVRPAQICVTASSRTLRMG